MDDRVSAVIAFAQAEFGEPEYAYFKKYVPWSSGRGRNSGHHIIPVGDGTPVTQDEYDAGIEKSDQCRCEAFMGRYQRSYWLFERKMTKSGWREKLIEIIKRHADSAGDEQ